MGQHGSLPKAEELRKGGRLPCGKRSAKRSKGIRRGTQESSAGAFGEPDAKGAGGEIYLEEHPTKANGYYIRDLLTLTGPLEDLKVPRVRQGDFHLQILPYRKLASLELSEAILTLYAVGVSTRKISRFLEGVYGAFYSPQSISRLIQVTADRVKAWRERPLAEEYYAVFLDGTFLSIRRGKASKEPVYIALGIKPDGRREVLGFWLFGAEGEGKVPTTGRRCSRSSSGAGSEGFRSSSPMTFQA